MRSSRSMPLGGATSRLRGGTSMRTVRVIGRTTPGRHLLPAARSTRRSAPAARSDRSCDRHAVPVPRSTPRSAAVPARSARRPVRQPARRSVRTPARGLARSNGSHRWSLDHHRCFGLRVMTSTISGCGFRLRNRRGDFGAASISAAMLGHDLEHGRNDLDRRFGRGFCVGFERLEEIVGRRGLGRGHSRRARVPAATGCGSPSRARAPACPPKRPREGRVRRLA